MQEQKEDNDLIVPFTPNNKFLTFLFKNKEISKVAYRQVILCFAIASLILISVAIFMFAAMSQVVTQQQIYFSPNSNNCQLGTICTVTFNLPNTMQAPVYLLYRLDDFFQNHRRYIQSKSNHQLSGNDIAISDAHLCSPYITNGDMKVTKSWAGVPLDPNAVASPCGAIAFTYFTDRFSLSSNGIGIPVSSEGISWPGDKGGKYRRTPNSNQTQWVDPENELFIVWMRTAGLPNFKKLWGRIDQNLPAGEYQMQITNNYNIAEWTGNKYFILTTNSAAGGTNYLLPILFLLVGVASIVAVLIFWRKALEYRRCLEE